MWIAVLSANQPSVMHGVKLCYALHAVLNKTSLLPSFEHKHVVLCCALTLVNTSTACQSSAHSAILQIAFRQGQGNS